MKARTLLPLVLALLIAHFSQADNEIGFVEKFALAPDRAAVLSQLIPGSEEYYFYHALHFQNTRQAEKLKTIMEQWAKRYPDSGQRRIIENREALLSYDANPQATLAFLRERLNLEFHHQQEVRDKAPDLPATLDQKLIGREVFLREALQNSDDLGHLDTTGYESLVREKVALNPAQKRALLAKILRPDIAGLIELIEADLKTQESKGFGEFQIHKLLLPEQLDELGRRIPALWDHQGFVYARLRKLAPSADADAEFDVTEREAWLERAWALAKSLGPSFNTLKAHILYRRLQHDRSRGIYDKARFIEYLKLPRRLDYVSPVYLDPPRRAGLAAAEFRARTELVAHPVDLNADLSEALLAAPPIGNDEPLVRDYLIQLLKDEPKWEPWAVWLRDTYVKALFAEAKIVHGIGDPEQWTSLLSPSAYQALKERVDVDFAPTNPRFFAPADEVKLGLFIKNAPNLIVKIYEINTLSYFLTQTRQLNTDLPLDGLVANSEKTQTLDVSPLRRVAHSFDFPEVKGRRGAWVIEFIGGGKSSRALIRKGQWHVLQQTGPAGDMLTVLDEQRRPIRDAAVWLEGRKFTADEKSGRIVVPFSAQPGNKPLVLADAAGEFATLASFEHHTEQYRLDGQFHIAREQLLAGKNASLAIRASLLLGDAQLALDLLQDLKLTITSTTLDGVSTTQEVTTAKFDVAKVLTHVFAVPDRLANLTATLSGKVEKLSMGGTKEDLAASETWQVNGIDRTEATSDGHLSKFGGNHVFELLGKNGEPLPDQQVVFEFEHRDFLHPVTIPLRTDERGRVNLGGLAGIESISTKLPEERAREWTLETDGAVRRTAIHAKAGEMILVPWLGAAVLRPDDVSLLAKRGETFTGDHFNALSVVNGYLQIKGLPPGDYSLLLRRSWEEIAIRVTAGEPVQNWLVSETRHLEVRESTPVHIEALREEPQALVIQVRNAGPFTRVHIVASRFFPDDKRLATLAEFTRFEPALALPARRPNLFVAGRAIGDEYRYILERRYAKLFPGNMLTRPGLLLNPWEVRSTDLSGQTLQRGEAARRAGGDRESMQRKAVPAATNHKGIAPDERETGPNLDFLATAGPALYNLVPDKDGLVRIDRKLLGDRQYVQVYAEDLSGAVWRSIALAEADTKFRDLRLVRNLDPQKHFTEKKEVTVLTAGQTFSLADVLTSEMTAFDTLASIHSLFTTLNKDANLAKFAWVLQWPKLKPEEKRAKYSEFACHELSFFLSRKDQEFFEQVVKPYLRNKKDKTFMDEYLLGEDLRRHLEPWFYARLNVVERALLGRTLPGEAAAAARHLRELYDLVPPDPERLDRLFETALRGRALTPAETDGLAVTHRFAGEAVAGGIAGMDSAPAVPAAAAPALKRATDESRRAIAAGREVQLSLAQKAEAEGKLVQEALGDTLAKNLTDLAANVTLGKDAYFFRAEDAVRERGMVRQFYRRLGTTKEWAENNYYQLPIAQQKAELITINAFWRDFGAWDGKTPFLSQNVAEASRNFSEMMLALGVLDLPFEAAKHQTKTENNQFTLTAAGPILVFHKQIKPSASAPEQTELLVTENFYRHGDRYREEGNEKFDKYVTDEFLTGVVYGANVVVTNPSSSPHTLTLLLQIPRGALPVLGSKATDTKRVRLEPFTTQTFQYAFYFPVPNAAGEPPFPHFPVHVARAEQTVGVAKPFAFKVVKQLSQIDKTSWEYLSQYGTEADVLTFLDQRNLGRLDLEKIAWRVRASAEFLRKLIAVLEKRHVYHDVIYSYAVLHNEPGALREWLRHRDDFIAQCGPGFDSKLVRVDPIERRAYEHLEYAPLINQRTHRVGAEHRMPNPVARGQYQGLLRILAHKTTLDPIDQMSVVYYLFLQDRVEEALGRFASIKPETLPTRLQHDYFRCYAAVYEEKLPEARAIAAQHATQPVDRWRKLFLDAAAQLDEIEGKPVAAPLVQSDKPDRDAQQGALAATEPSFDLKVENRTIALTWRNLREVTINYYLMDPEFLFSSSPFVTQDAGRFSIVKPTHSARQVLPENAESLEVPLPAEFQRANVLVEVLGAGQRKAQAYHANTLKLNLVENYGRLEVRDLADGKPVSKAYVKVYARLKNGQLRFFKDGYTDLRGKFDYASLNASEAEAQPVPRPSAESGTPGAGFDYQMLRPGEITQVEKLAMLIISHAHGALVREMNPPGE